MNSHLRRKRRRRVEREGRRFWAAMREIYVGPGGPLEISEVPLFGGRGEGVEFAVPVRRRVS